MKLIVGLGNIGTLYDNTRHNLGFMCLDYFAKQHNLTFKEDVVDFYDTFYGFEVDQSLITR